MSQGPAMREAEAVRSWPPTTVRLPPYLREALAKRANENYHSVSAELLVILCREFGFHIPNRVREEVQGTLNQRPGVSHAA